MSMSLATKNRALTSVRPHTTVSSLRVSTGAFANGAGARTVIACVADALASCGVAVGSSVSGSTRWGGGESTTSWLLVHPNAV
jgi:hypothetical protein